MTLKEIFKTIEGLTILTSFILILLTGFKVFAYLGLVGYAIVNINGGVDKAKRLLKYLFNKVKFLLKTKK